MVPVAELMDMRCGRARAHKRLWHCCNNGVHWMPEVRDDMFGRKLLFNVLPVDAS